MHAIANDNVLTIFSLSNSYANFSNSNDLSVDALPACNKPNAMLAPSP